MLYNHLITDDLGITLTAEFIQSTNHPLYFWVATPSTTERNNKAVDELNAMLDDLNMRNGVIAGLQSNRDTYHFIQDRIVEDYPPKVAEMLVIRAVPASLMTE